MVGHGWYRQNYFLLVPLLLALPFPKDFPSKPGRPLSFDLTPLALSFRRSVRIAMLSVLFFCFVAIEVAS